MERTVSLNSMDQLQLNVLNMLNQIQTTLDGDELVHAFGESSFKQHLTADIELLRGKIAGLSNFFTFLLTSQAPMVQSANCGYFAILPPELILHIFSFLGVRELCRCSLLCKELKAIATQDQLYEGICRLMGLYSKPLLKTWRWVAQSNYVIYTDRVKEGCGTYSWPEDKGTYVGDWIKNFRNGFGVHKWNDGSTYEGEWSDDKRHGFGTMTWADGQLYRGYWKNGRKEGKGEEVWADGRRYVGEYKNSNMHGHGVYTWPGGDRYEGEWKEDNMHGYGVYCWGNGSRYEGSWESDEHNGFGKYTCPQGESYEGEWKNNARHGQGEERWANGTSFKGQWKENRKDGKGIFTWPDGDYYLGDWKEGRRSGKGFFVCKNKVYYQNFLDTTEVYDEQDKVQSIAIELGLLEEMDKPLGELDPDRILKRKRSDEGEDNQKSRKKKKLV